MKKFMERFIEAVRKRSCYHMRREDLFFRIIPVRG